jgi:NAD(P)H-dependent FMN reductase
MLVQIVTGTTREGRFSERVARWVTNELEDRTYFDVETVDLRDHPLPFFYGAAPLHTPREYHREDVAALGRTLDRADGFIMLTAEYNHGYPAVLKNAMDWTFVEWRRKPMSFIGWGNVGGARAIEQLRQVAVEFEMAPLRHAVHILPDVMRPMLRGEDPDDLSPLQPLVPRLDQLVDELSWWTRALAAARAEDAS